LNRRAIPDVNLMMNEAAMVALKTGSVPPGIAALAKEVCAHVVIGALHLPPQFAEIGDHL
jgi:hypothetical protein